MPRNKKEDRIGRLLRETEEKCQPFYRQVRETLKGMRITREYSPVGNCVVDFKNPKVKDYGYEEVGLKTMEPEEGGAIALSLTRAKVEGQIPMPFNTYDYSRELPFMPFCSEEESMIHGATGDPVSFAVFIDCQNTPDFWKSLEKTVKDILDAGHATGLTRKQREEL